MHIIRKLLFNTRFNFLAVWNSKLLFIFLPQRPTKVRCSGDPGRVAMQLSRTGQKNKSPGFYTKSYMKGKGVLNVTL